MLAGAGPRIRVRGVGQERLVGQAFEERQHLGALGLGEVEGPDERAFERVLAPGARVGTGGDGYNTFNVSTTAAIVAAGAGARVCKVSQRPLFAPAQLILVCLARKQSIYIILGLCRRSCCTRMPPTSLYYDADQESSFHLPRSPKLSPSHCSHRPKRSHRI